MCDIFKNELLMLLNDKVDDNTLINNCIILCGMTYQY